jgi:hypothetical protein
MNKQEADEREVPCMAVDCGDSDAAIGRVTEKVWSDPRSSNSVVQGFFKIGLVDRFDRSPCLEDFCNEIEEPFE